MSSKWRENTSALAYKNKGNIQSCENYKEIKLMSLKLWKRVIEQRIMRETKVFANQFCFMLEVNNGSYLLPEERSKEEQKDLYMV